MKIQRFDLPPYCYASRELRTIRGIVVHYVSAYYVDADNRFDVTAIRNLICDLNRSADQRRWYEIDHPDRLYASYHYFIDRNGCVYQLTPLDRVAYHAGKSKMHDREGCNEFTAGIALAATHESGYTDAQYTSLERLCLDLMADHPIDVDSIQGHDAVATPAGRKRDPGPRFDWSRVRAAIREYA